MLLIHLHSLGHVYISRNPGLAIDPNKTLRAARGTRQLRGSERLTLSEEHLQF